MLSNTILYNGEEFDISEFDLDGQGQLDPPPPLTAEACGCCERTMRNRRAQCGEDYRKHYYYMLHRKGICRPAAERAWMRSLALWTRRQGFTNPL
ncbi:MAG: hypothetical protein ACI9FZ_000891 [Bacteroidia bacterium]|jgi:hypothetical protein